MKKILTGLLCIVMLLGVVIPASAAETSKSTVVSCDNGPTYQVVIPTSVNIKYSTGKATLDVSAKNINIGSEFGLIMDVSSANYDDGWKMIDEETSDYLGYFIGVTEGGKEISNNSTVLSAKNGQSITSTLHLTIDKTVPKTGSFKDTLTFNIGVIPVGEIDVFSTFSSNDWSDIISAVESGNIPSTWSVGDSKYMIIGNESYEVQIIGKNHDTYTDGGTAPLTFQLVKAQSQKAMNATADNTTGWAGSEMRNTTLENILASMPAEVQAAIKSVDKQTLKGDKSGLETTSDKLFLLSEVEVLGTTSQSNENVEGVQYDYYANGGDLIKQYYSTNNWTDTPVHWWLRGPAFSNGTHFSRINSGGSLSSGSAETIMGVVFGFCF